MEWYEEIELAVLEDAYQILGDDLARKSKLNLWALRHKRRQEKTAKSQNPSAAELPTRRPLGNDVSDNTGGR